MTTKSYVTQKFENSDYNPEIIIEKQTFLDETTLEYVTKDVERAKPLTDEEVAVAKSNLNYKRASLVAEHLSALGLATNVGLNSITITCTDAQILQSEG